MQGLGLRNCVSSYYRIFLTGTNIVMTKLQNNMIYDIGLQLRINRSEYEQHYSYKCKC